MDSTMINFACADASTLHSNFTAALSRVCQAIDWDYAEVWMPDSETKLLELSPVWYCHPNRDCDRLDALEKFRACSEKFVLAIDEGLPGRIWRSGQPEWINDVSLQSENYFLRHQIAKAFNIRAGFGFPVVHAQAIVGIFVFFSESASEVDPRLIQLAIAAATPDSA
ncbi:GAF domain-containing protein [Cyanobacteria bacterium FACHB-63]|nr:GAF domain-containing protein [Cyanobacteria bacterium FACHB-63]